MYDYSLICVCQLMVWLDSQGFGRGVIGELIKKFEEGGQTFVRAQGMMIFVSPVSEIESHFFLKIMITK